MESGRRYRPEDLALVKEMARRRLLANIQRKGALSVNATDALVSHLFHVLCVKNLPQPTDTLNLPDDYLDNWFCRDYEHTMKLFRRLYGRLNVEGKSVLDVGSGLGPTCIYAALHGARRVVGIDINCTMGCLYAFKN